MAQATVQRSDKFAPLYEPPPGTDLIICIGGRGGMKTYEVSKFVAFSATILRKRSCILRDEKELIRESILNEVLLRYDTANESDALTPHYERLDTGIKDKKTGSMLVFTKGFRASSNTKSANLKGASDIDIAVIEEAEDIRDEDKFNTFRDSLRKDGCITIVILNTPDINHWIIKRYFTTEPVKDHDGYFKIVPKTVPGTVVIQTNYTDNPYLPEGVKRRYRSYGDPESDMYNPHHYLTAIMGYATSGKKGQVFKKVKPITLRDYLALPYREIYGQDFGTASAAGLVGIKVHRNQLFVRELNYQPMTTLEIGILYCKLGFNASDLIVADCADPKAIDKLRNGWRPTELPEDILALYPRLAIGFNVVPSQKGKDSITNGISELNEMEFFLTEDSKNAWNEVANYVYATDKNGNPTDVPVDEFNHLLDPTRYAVAEVKKPRANAPISL